MSPEVEKLIYRKGGYMPKWDNFILLWKEEVYDRYKEVDPLDEYTREGIIVGWAIAKGFTIDDARSFAGFIACCTTMQHLHEDDRNQNVI